MARAVAKLEAHLDDTKSAKAHLKAAEEEIQAEIRKLARIVTDKWEYRDVTVEIVADDERHQAIETRMDTGEIHHVRVLSNDEQQIELPLPGPEKKHDDADKPGATHRIWWWAGNEWKVIGAGTEHECGNQVQKLIDEDHAEDGSVDGTDYRVRAVEKGVPTEPPKGKTAAAPRKRGSPANA